MIIGAMPAWCLIVSLIMCLPLGTIWIRRLGGLQLAGLWVLVVTGLLGLAARGGRPWVEDFGALVEWGHYSFHLRFFWDGWGAAMTLLATLVFSIVLRFSHGYLHRDPGYHRFFLVLAWTVSGVVLTATSGNIDLLLTGWEWVGTCSVLLIGFFWEQNRSASNALRAWVMYRTGDVFLLVAAIGLHRELAFAEQMIFDHHGTWTREPGLSSLYAICLVLAITAKSAQLPLTNWIHRAMEGPTSSSAVFYGALSIHLGPFLLIRTAPVWQHNPAAVNLLIALGLSTMVVATLIGRVRTDIKSQLAYAAVAQVSIIVVEVAMGWRHLAMLHLCAHAALRTSQYLRSGSVIEDLWDSSDRRWLVHGRRRPWFESLLPVWLQKRAFVVASQFFYLDVLHARVAHWATAPARWPSWVWGLGACITVTGCLSQGLASTWTTANLVVWSIVVGLGALGSRGARRAAWWAWISQGLLLQNAWILGSGGASPWIALVPMLPVLLWIVWVLRYSEVADRSLEELGGLARNYPRLSVVSFLLILLAIGIPGSPSFFAEDWLFHRFLETKSAILFGAILAVAIQGIALFRLHVQLFWGAFSPHRRFPVGSAP